MSQEPSVSDHAIVRYFERVLGLDLDTIRARILTDEVKLEMEVGASRIQLTGEPECELVLKNNTVVTIQPNNLRDHKRQLKAKRGCRLDVNGHWPQ